MKILLILLFTGSVNIFASDECEVMSHERNLPKEMIELLDRKGYRLSYFDLDNYSRDSIDSIYKIKFKQVYRGAFGDPVYKMKFKGNGIKIKAKGLNKSELVQVLTEELNSCL